MATNCLITDLLRNLVGALSRTGNMTDEVAEEHAKALRFLEAFHHMGVDKLPCDTRR